MLPRADSFLLPPSVLPQSRALCLLLRRASCVWFVVALCASALVRLAYYCARLNAHLLCP